MMVSLGTRSMMMGSGTGTGTGTVLTMIGLLGSALLRLVASIDHRHSQGERYQGDELGGLCELHDQCNCIIVFRVRGAPRSFQLERDFEIVRRMELSLRSHKMMAAELNRDDALQRQAYRRLNREDYP